MHVPSAIPKEDGYDDLSSGFPPRSFLLPSTSTLLMFLIDTSPQTPPLTILPLSFRATPNIR
jgi:hypothetical protein